MPGEQQLSALGALAAATAHELGTPLATIHLTAKELQRMIKPGQPAREDVELIVEQADRCRAILKQISQRRRMTDAAMSRTPLPSSSRKRPSRTRPSGIHIQCSCSPARRVRRERGAGPIVVRKPEIIHALGAFVENAASFATKEVSVNARWSKDEVRIYVTDDGPGFAPSVLAKLGEPYFSERSIEQRGGAWASASSSP